MQLLGHKQSETARHYYCLHDEEACRQMDRLDPPGNKTGEQSPDPDEGLHIETGGVEPGQT
jgi:hypothetical protein